MNKQRLLFIILLIIFALAGVALIVFNFFVPKASGLLIETSPASTVYINGEEVGRTPYTSIRKPGEITLRCIPDSFGTPLAPFEEKISLVSGVETVVRRYFGISDVFTEGEVLSFEKMPDRNATGITVVTEPENVQIRVNGADRGVTPFTTKTVNEGITKLNLVAAGYKDREVEVNLVKGYGLIAFIKMSKTEAVVLPDNEEKETGVKVVKILDTPTGFLRVRKEASSSAVEVGRVNEGEEYNLIEESNAGDWFKISPLQGVEGWVTAQYSEITTKASSATDSAKTL